MPRLIATAAAADFTSPGRRDYWIRLRHTSVAAAHLIPVTVLVGPEARPGEGLVAFGACHGNEYEGPVAIKHLLREIRTAHVRGRIILVPLLNVAAFRVGARESTGDDGVNLNRVFVDGAGTTPAMAGITSRIVEFVRQVIWPNVHIAIDVHSGGEVARFIHRTSFFTHEDPAISARRERMARWFGTPVVLSSTNSPGGSISRGLYQEADDLGKDWIGTELGFGASTNVRGVRYARHGILAAAIQRGQLHGAVEPICHHADGTQRLLRNRASVTAPYRGHYEPLVDCGQFVSAGQTVGFLHDFNRIDEEPLGVVAGLNGVLVSQAWGARVEQGQMIVMVAAA